MGPLLLVILFYPLSTTSTDFTLHKTINLREMTFFSLSFFFIFGYLIILPFVYNRITLKSEVRDAVLTTGTRFPILQCSYGSTLRPHISENLFQKCLLASMTCEIQVNMPLPRHDDLAKYFYEPDNHTGVSDWSLRLLFFPRSGERWAVVLNTTSPRHTPTFHQNKNSNFAQKRLKRFSSFSTPGK